jgi:hypothetical protein
MGTMTNFTLRDHLAGQAIAGAVVDLRQGLASEGHRRDELLTELSTAAYALADAMLVARAGQDEQPLDHPTEPDAVTQIARQARKRLGWPDKSGPKV